jgi:hypothetical protein
VSEGYGERRYPVTREQESDLGYHRWFGSARYLGGHTRFSEGWAGVLFFTETAIGLGKSTTSGPLETVIPMNTVTSIQITGQRVAKSKVGPVIVFGLMGLAAKGSMHETTVVVRTNDGETVYYAIADRTPDEARAVLTPFLGWLRIPFYDERQPAPEARPSPGSDFADELRKLAALRDDGLLTQAEFDAQKSHLLNARLASPSPQAVPPPPSTR